MASRWKHLRRCALRDHVACLIADGPLHISAHRKWVPVSISFLSLIVPCAFPLTGCAFLHRQSITPATDCPLHVSAHSKWVPASMSFKSLIIPCAFLLTESVFLYQWSIIPVTDCPLHIPAHSSCVSVSTEYRSCHWLSPADSRSQRVGFCIDRVSFLSLIVPCMSLLIGSEYCINIIHITDHLLCIPARRACVSASKEYYSYHWLSPVHSCSQLVRFCIDGVSFLSLIVLHMFLLIGSEYLHQYHSHHWLSPVHSCS